MQPHVAAQDLAHSALDLDAVAVAAGVEQAAASGDTVDAAARRTLVDLQDLAGLQHL